MIARLGISRSALAIVVVAALGYFVDVYDLILFSVIRTASLTSLGLAGDDLLSVGLHLLNIQLAGVLLGGIVFGVLGDKFGRLSVLFGSIILYSTANLLNAYVTSVEQYEILRFLAGVGLAGELGVGVTIVSEVLPAKLRGLGTMLVAAVGLLGAVAASQAGSHLTWRQSFTLGGLMGLGLLVLRIGLAESSLFRSLLSTSVRRGSLALLFSEPKRIGRFVLCTLAGLPLYFVIGILITASPEIGRALGLATAPSAAIAVMVAYIAMSVGDVACSVWSQFRRSRREALMTFHCILAAATLVYLWLPTTSLTAFYWKCSFLGFGIGFWAVLVTNASEQFGTNLRATVTTLVPNMVRAMLIPISALFIPLKAAIGITAAGTWVGLGCILIALVATHLLQEPFGRSLDFVES